MHFQRMLWVCACLTVLWTGESQAEAQRFLIVQSGETTGHLDVEKSESRVRVDYADAENGRGARIKEDIRLDRHGMPIDWKIDGLSLVGSPVHERFSWKRGHAQWTSQADRGDIASPEPRIYIGNDASPWIFGLYAKLLLNTPNQELPVLPSGTLRLKEVGRTVLMHREQRIGVRILQLSGINLEPDYVVLDEHDELLMKDEVIRDGYQDLRETIQDLTNDARFAEARQAQGKLAHRFAGPVRIRNVRVFDPAAMRLTELSDVVFYRDRITGIYPAGGTSSVADETLIEGEGGTIVPGLYDMHHHTTIASGFMNLAVGVTSVRDMGNDNELLLRISSEIEGERIPGSRIVRNGFLEGRSPYSARDGFIADTLTSALEDVRWYADHGYSQIKIYNSVPPDWVSPIAKEAHRLGMGVTGHIPAFSSPERVVKEGYDDIAHIGLVLLCLSIGPDEDTRTAARITGTYRLKDLDLTSTRVRDLLALMKEHNVAQDTTAMIEERLMLSRTGQVQEGDRPYFDHVPIGYQRYRKRSYMTINSGKDDAAYKLGFQKIIDAMGLMDRAGIQLLPGTDDTTGFALLRELELYVKAGMTPAKALFYATLGAARRTHRDADLGTIERGKLADFLLVKGDPTTDISALRRNAMTVKNGTVYFPSEMFEYLSIKPFVSPPAVQRPR